MHLFNSFLLNNSFFPKTPKSRYIRHSWLAALCPFWQRPESARIPTSPRHNSGLILTDIQQLVSVCASEQMPAEGFPAKVSQSISEFLQGKTDKDDRDSPHFCWVLLRLDVMSGTAAAIYDYEMSQAKNDRAGR